MRAPVDLTSSLAVSLILLICQLLTNVDGEFS